MNKKVYLKDESFDPIYREVSRGFYAKTRVMPTLLIFAGFFVFSTQVLLPLMVFKTSDKPNEVIDNATVLGRLAGFSEFEFRELKSSEPTQETPAVNIDEQAYLPGQSEAVKGAKDTNVPEYFYLSIPKLKIKNAKVETNAETLNPEHALGHYPGTQLPGEPGNAFIFGHSVLPWFFNPRNYKTIFSTLGDLESGDKIYVTINNRQLTYMVENKEELPPSEVDPLAKIKPAYLNESTMVLMTCSPPGTRLRRLLVNAVMTN
jgi:sortase A